MSSMRCLKCGYDLRGLPEPRCPECGRAFNPDDPSTFVVLKSAGKALLFDAWIAVALSAFGPGAFVIAWLTGSLTLGNIFSASVVPVSPHMLLGAVLGALVLWRCLRMPIAGFADEKTRRTLRWAIWLALIAAVVSLGCFALAVVQFGRASWFF